MDIAKRKGVVVWLTGISDAGKSTIARALATRMQTDGIRSMVLDGDVLQTGLNSDPGFSEAELTENLRRVAHVAALFCNEGYVVVTATISPNPEHRENARKIVGEEAYVEVFVDTPLEVCESREPEKIYKRCRRGEIKQLTDLGTAYHPPENPHLVLYTERAEVRQNVGEVVAYLVCVGRYAA